MNRLPALLASYERYHRDPRNRLTHYAGVPLISYAALAALALVRWHGLDVRATLDRPVLAALAVLYLYWDVSLGLALVVLLAVLAAAAEWTARLGTQMTLIIAAATFVTGWALQLLGHHLEGNRPALLDNLLQILVAPIFLTAEAAFALGLRGQLRALMQRAGR